MAFDDNWVMSYNDLQELVDTEGFTAIATIPVSTQLVGKGHVMTYLDVNPDYFDTWSSIRMVPRALIHKPDVVVPVHKQYYYGQARTSSVNDGLCGLTESSWNAAYYEGAGDYPVSGDTAYNGVNDDTPMNGDGLYRILRNTTTEVQYNIAVASNGTITVYECLTSGGWTEFYISSTGAWGSSSEACSSSSGNTWWWHNGSGIIPDVGDFISAVDGGHTNPLPGWRRTYTDYPNDSSRWAIYSDINGQVTLKIEC